MLKQEEDAEHCIKVVICVYFILVSRKRVNKFIVKYNYTSLLEKQIRNILDCCSRMIIGFVFFIYQFPLVFYLWESVGVLFPQLRGGGSQTGIILFGRTATFFPYEQQLSPVPGGQLFLNKHNFRNHFQQICSSFEQHIDKSFVY